MIISHSHKLIFIKSFKTASTSVESILSNYCSGADIVTPLGDYPFNRDESGAWVHKSMNESNFKQHDDALTIKNAIAPEIWDSYFKISLARNPWDRVVSFFYWEHRNDPAIRPKKPFWHKLGVPFDAMAQIRPLFRKFLDTDKWVSNDPFYVLDGKLCVDFVIRYESLNEDVGEICKRLNLPVKDLPRLKSGIREGHHHYSEYYDEESKAIVAERHKNDIRLLGYQFEQQRATRP